MGFTTRYVKRWKGGIYIVHDMTKESYFLVESPCTNCIVRETCVQESERVYTISTKGHVEKRTNLLIKMCIDALVYYYKFGWVFTDTTEEEHEAIKESIKTGD